MPTPFLYTLIHRVPPWGARVGPWLAHNLLPSCRHVHGGDVGVQGDGLKLEAAVWRDPPLLVTKGAPPSVSWGGRGCCWWKLLTPHVLCPQEPDQVYEGITFDDFLKVGV